MHESESNDPRVKGETRGYQIERRIAISQRSWGRIKLKHVMYAWESKRDPNVNYAILELSRMDQKRADGDIQKA